MSTGCDRLTALIGGDKPPEVDEKPAEIAKDPKAPPTVTKPVPDTDTAELTPLIRARRRLSLPARGASHLGFNLDTIDGQKALAGALEIPEWSVPGTGDVRAMRDDDLESAWECQPEAHKPCAIGIHLAKAAEVRAVRFYAAAPGEAYEQHARLAKLRVHSDEGWFDADVLDGPHYAYVVFGRPVKTSTLVLEILATHGRKQGGLHVAELDVFGHGGTARDPLVIDPARIITVVDGKPWSKGHDGQLRGASFLETLNDDGTTRRIMPGTAIYGRAEDDIVLVEALSGSDCRTHQGLFFLLNRKTRVPVPVGELGGMGGQVFRSRDGLGFVAGFVDEVEARVTGVVLEGDSYKHRRSQRLAAVEGPASLDAWGIDRAPLQRGGAPLNRPVEGCALGSDDTLAMLRTAVRGKAEGKPGEWTVCDLADGARVFVSDHGPCGKSWEITILDAANKVVATKAAKRKGALLRTRRSAAKELLVEVGGSDDAVELFRATKTGLVSLGDRAFAAPAPEKCRNRCDDTLVNNSIP